jgi:dCTP deaminase
VLSDTDIMRAIRHEHLTITPFSAHLVQPASVDVRLDRFIRTFEDNHFIDPGEENNTSAADLGKQGKYYLDPGEFVLGSTYEHIRLDSTLSARFEGKSSIGRLGLFTHVTAGFIDPGFAGTITLELYNANNKPLIVYAGMRIGQICFFQMDSYPRAAYGEKLYGSRYQDQVGPTPSQSFINFSSGLTD